MHVQVLARNDGNRRRSQLGKVHGGGGHCQRTERNGDRCERFEIVHCRVPLITWTKRSAAVPPPSACRRAATRSTRGRRGQDAESDATTGHCGARQPISA